MRNSMGAAWVFGICLTFIVLFTAYLAITLNYAKAFRIKNNVISKIEEHGGYEQSLDDGIKEYIYNQGLQAYGKCDTRITTDDDRDWDLVGTISNGDVPADQSNVCIYRSVKHSKTEDGPKQQYVYRVVTFFRFDIPIVRYFSSFRVAGESRYIYDYTV